MRNVAASFRRLFKDVHALAETAPILPTASHGSLALNDDQDDLTVSGRFRATIAWTQPVERETDIALAGRLRRDLVHLAVCAKGLA